MDEGPDLKSPEELEVGEMVGERMLAGEWISLFKAGLD
jgi:hypothetical protein